MAPLYGVCFLETPASLDCLPWEGSQFGRDANHFGAREASFLHHITCLLAARCYTDPETSLNFWDRPVMTGLVYQVKPNQTESQCDMAPFWCSASCVRKRGRHCPPPHLHALLCNHRSGLGHFLAHLSQQRSTTAWNNNVQSRLQNICKMMQHDAK